MRLWPPQKRKKPSRYLDWARLCFVAIGYRRQIPLLALKTR